jgi:hypothetical protein
MKIYVYGMRLRGFAPMCQPTLNLVARRNDTSGKYYDLLEYDKPLTEREIQEYELDFIEEYML